MDDDTFIKLKDIMPLPVENNASLSHIGHADFGLPFDVSIIICRNQGR